MKIFFTLLIVCIFGGAARGQNDLMILRKGHRTIKQYYPGMHIDFYIDGNQLIGGQLVAVKNDSLYLDQYDIRRGYTGWGSVFFDTVSTYHLIFAYKDIIGLPATQKMGSVSLPVLMMVGSAGYAGLNIINAGTQKQSLTGSENLQRLGIAAGVFATGYIWKKVKTKKSYWPIGKKYKLMYLSVGTPK